MKKQIISIGIIASLLAANTLPAYAAEDYETTRPFTAHRMVSKIAERLGIDNLGELITETFTEEDVGQNMYLRIYDKIQEKVEDRTTRLVAEKLGVTSSEIEDFISGDVASIMKYAENDCKIKTPKSSCKIDIKKALGFTQKIQNLIDVTREEERSKANIEENLVATEIYANGNTADSGFDLLADLNIIDKLLFQKETITYPAPTVGAEKDISLSELLEKRAESPESGAKAEEPQAPAPRPAEPREPQKKQEPQAEQEESSAGGRECFSDKNLSLALEKYETATGTSALTSGGSIKSGPDADASRPQDSTHVGDEMIPAPAAKRLSEELCPVDIDAGGAKIGFCLEQKWTWRPVTFSQRTDNCIACHIQQINDLFKKTLSHSLIPNKITGNLYEPAKCKSGFGLTDIDMNAFLIWNPIITPPNDDLLFKSSPFASWKRLQELYPYNFIDKLIPDSARTQTTAERSADWLLSLARETTTQPEILNGIQKMVAGQEKELAQKLENLETISLAEAQNSNTQALTYEMNMMQQLFDSFLTMFIDIVETPCKGLAKKPVTN